MGKKHKPEEITCKLREAEIVLALGYRVIETTATDLAIHVVLGRAPAA